MVIHGALCFPYGRAEKKDRGNHHRTAAREASEETCYALGLPDEIYNKHFRGKTPQRFGGAYLVDLGLMTEEDRNNVIKRHLDNRNGNGLKKVLGRKPTGCEREMRQLKWCDGTTFLTHARSGSIPGFGHFRGFCAGIMRKMASSQSFSKWCMPSNSDIKMSDAEEEEDVMLALALSASLADQEAVGGGFNEEPTSKRRKV